MHKLLLLFAFMIVSGGLWAQTATGFTPSVYRTAENPYYWGNRKPDAGYWQQDVHYKIEARLDDSDDRIDGALEVTYWNNSPDTLTEVWFHLYQNVTEAHSHAQQYQVQLKEKSMQSQVPEKQGIRIYELKQEEQTCETFEDNTLLRVTLQKPIFPNGYTVFRMRFSSWAGNSRYTVFPVNEKQPDGSIKQVKHYNIVHWYPRIAVYDRQFSWAAQHHIGKEYYGNFGSYDVALTLPGHYILDGTGIMLNEAEMLPPDLRKRLDVANFKDKPLGQAADQLLPPDGQTKTWKFHALNVHDVAYSADPTYRLIETQWNGIRCIGMAREEHAAGWQDAAEFTERVIRLFSKDFGLYGYPKMICADANSGMEYPMITLDGGTSPGYKGLFVHEIGHNWFYGMVGSNETYRAFLDEGFTQFLTSWGMVALEGRGAEDSYQKRYWNAYYMYLLFARKGYDGTLHTHSNDYHGNQYGMVYLKTSTMLYNLQYVLGDSLFLGAMQHYFHKWKFCHPYPQDFREAITEYAKTDLTWFFDQWLETDKQIDYRICRVKRRGQETRITFYRKGDMQMPLDIDVVTRQGDTLRYLVPTSYFDKKETGRTTLPMWVTWADYNRKHTISLQTPGPVKRVIIDPSYRLADLDLTNNSSGCLLNRTDFTFWRKGFAPLEWRKYQMNLYPNLWWNGQAGVQAGATLQGAYLQEQRVFNATVWYNSSLGQLERPDLNDPLWPHAQNAFLGDVHPLSYRLDYSSFLKPLGKLAHWHLRSQFQDGLLLQQIGFTKSLPRYFYNQQPVFQLYGHYRYMLRDNRHANYLLYPGLWTTNRANATITLGIRQQYKFVGGKGSNQLELRTAAPGNDGFWATLQWTARHNFSLGKKLDLHTRLFGQYGDGQLPLESALYLAGASPEQYYAEDLLRARGFVPDSWLVQDRGASVAHFQQGGGLNLRGYAGYRPIVSDKGQPAWVGSTGAAFNAELDFDKLIPLKIRKLSKFISTDWYAFYDAGILGYSIPQKGLDGVVMDRLRQDAGLGTAWHFRHGNLSRQRKTTTLRLDIPLLLSNPPATDDFTALRWVVGVGRCF
ncbi:MAG: M1 family metallopeptidase [Bacteroidetes bacterium]|nr:M1 family metallopeptidase [Bacteroidota bacterium]